MKLKQQTKTQPQTEQEAHVRFISRMLQSRKKAEALRWLKGSSTGKRRMLGDFRGTKPSVELVEKLHALGAGKITAVDIKTGPTGSQRTEKLVLQLPVDAAARAALFKWCQRQGGKVGYSPDKDGGEQHLYLLLA